MRKKFQILKPYYDQSLKAFHLKMQNNSLVNETLIDWHNVSNEAKSEGSITTKCEIEKQKYIFEGEQHLCT